MSRACNTQRCPDHSVQGSTLAAFEFEGVFARVTWSDAVDAAEMKEAMTSQYMSKRSKRLHVEVEGEKQLGVYVSPSATASDENAAETARKHFAAVGQYYEFDVEYVVRAAAKVLYVETPDGSPCANVVLLVEQGKLVTAEDVNCLNPGSGTAVMQAIAHHDYDLLDQLLQIPGVDVNIADEDGMTALHWAAYHPYIVPEGNKVSTRFPYVYLLLVKEAKKNVENKYGRTPMEMTTDPDLRKVLDPSSAAAFFVLLALAQL